MSWVWRVSITKAILIFKNKLAEIKGSPTILDPIVACFTFFGRLRIEVPTF